MQLVTHSRCHTCGVQATQACLFGDSGNTTGECLHKVVNGDDDDKKLTEKIKSETK